MKNPTVSRAVPKLVNGRGTLPLVRTIGTVGGVNIGRMRIASGTTNPKVWQRYQDMIDDLIAMQRGDLLHALATKQTSLNDMLVLYKEQKLGSIPRINPNPDAAKTIVFRWLDTGTKRGGAPYSPDTIRAYRNNFEQLFKVGYGNEPLRKLPALLAKYRVQCVEKSHFTPFTQTRSACLAFARATEPDKQFSDLYRELAKVEPLSAPRKRQRNAVSLWEIKQLMKKLIPSHAQIVWNCAVCGFRFPSEYTTAWTVASDRVEIPGRKTVNANRFVPKLDGVRPEKLFESSFRKAFREASGKKLTPYDLRGVYRRLLSIAVHRGVIERTRAKFYFGHEHDVESNYEFHDFSLYLTDDAKALQVIVNELIKKKPTKSMWDDVEDIGVNDVKPL